MSAVVADTQAVVWYLMDTSRLTSAALEALRGAVGSGSSIYVASITLVEMRYLIEKGKLPTGLFEQVVAALEGEGAPFELAVLDLEVARALEGVKLELVPDMPDRIVTATAVALGVPLVSSDREIRASGHHVIW